MSGDTSVCFFEESGPVVHFTPERRTIISSIHLVLSESTAATKSNETLVLWGLIAPSDSLVSSDHAYAESNPVALASLPIEMPDRPSPCVSVSVPISRLELAAGATLSLTLLHVAVPPAVARRRLIQDDPPQRRKRSRSHNGWSTARTPSAGPSAPDVTATTWPEFLSVTVRLGGLSVGPPLPLTLSLCDWRPLLVQRWLECTVKKSTVVQPPPEKPDEMGMTRPTDRPREWWRPTRGSVMEASALSVDGKLVRWCSGAIGLASEFVPYARTYTPARPDKTIRVRRHPHRYADVVGEVLFGVSVEAIGQATDPFYEEVYVLLCLPDGLDGAQRLVADYQLASGGGRSGERAIWGWSKVSGRSGLALLRECAQSETPARRPSELLTPHHRRSRACDEPISTTALPPGSLFTCTQGASPVFIRENPTSASTVVGTLDTNEVKAAVALVVMPPASQPGSRGPTASPTPLDENAKKGTKNSVANKNLAENRQFVQWATGGYSLLSGDNEIYLTPVEMAVSSLIGNTTAQMSRGATLELPPLANPALP